jgi:hypothetical protein
MKKTCEQLIREYHSLKNRYEDLDDKDKRYFLDLYWVLMDYGYDMNEGATRVSYPNDY